MYSPVSFISSTYIDPKVRKGISSFATATNEEMEEGLLKLSNDVNKKEFTQKTRNYSSETGDYLFVVSEK